MKTAVASFLQPPFEPFECIEKGASKMTKCYSAGDFRKYFNENMQDLGLSVPPTLFDTYQKAVETVSLMVGALAHLSKGATMGELMGATFGLEKLAVVASIGAAAYTGAVIGSIAVATGRSLACGSRIADVLLFVHQNHLQFDGYSTFYRTNSQIWDKRQTFRQSFAVRAKNSPSSFEYA
jgi:hypothetical protein